MSRLQTILDLIGDARSDITAVILKEAYNDLEEHYNQLMNRTNTSFIWDFDYDIELDKTLEMLKSIETVYTWFSCDELESSIN